MAKPDSAFLWETEALRSTRPASGERAEAGHETWTDSADWLTLKEASDVTGVPAATIRKWARHDNVPSYLEKTPDGHLRIVSLTGIREWAGEIGRELEDRTTVPEDEPMAEVDLTSDEYSDDSEPGQSEVPDGSMLVPLDAWNKMLNQLGNLHEAGKQMAEARERAAKAETEAMFLKERLSEMRTELERSRQAYAHLVESRGEEAETEEPADARERERAGSTTLGGSATALAKRLYDGWLKRRRR